MLRDDGEVLPGSSRKGDWEGKGRGLRGPMIGQIRYQDFLKDKRLCERLGGGEELKVSGIVVSCPLPPLLYLLKYSCIIISRYC